MVPAWLRVEFDPTTDDVWTRVEREVALRPSAELVGWARVLGLAVSALPSHDRPRRPAVVATHTGEQTRRDIADLTVLDLSSLWAGPLCARLLADRGARVIKVESSARPDGVHAGPPEFDELLNGNKERVELDLRSDAGVDELRALIADAAVVIEASRPRAMQQLGIPTTGPAVWVSITGYGRDHDWIAFGDDAAVAGGLVVFDANGPCFCLDAVADPLTGMVAAAATLDAIDAGNAVLLDVAMAAVAAQFADREC
jgi:crotonobetainyl-CoA:carnitine CoA-transferase CaiB-like acyl-CoA transferase